MYISICAICVCAPRMECTLYWPGCSCEFKSKVIVLFRILCTAMRWMCHIIETTKRLFWDLLINMLFRSFCRVYQLLSFGHSTNPILTIKRNEWIWFSALWIVWIERFTWVVITHKSYASTGHVITWNELLFYLIRIDRITEALSSLYQFGEFS